MKIRTSVKLVLALVFILGLIASPSTAAPPSEVRPEPNAPVSPARVAGAETPLDAFDGQTWLVTWHGWASGHKDTTYYGENREVLDESLSADGSAIARYFSTTDPHWISEPFNQTVTHDRREQHFSTIYCGQEKTDTRMSLLDKGGQINPEKTTYVSATVIQKPDGTYSMGFPVHGIGPYGPPRYYRDIRTERMDSCAQPSSFTSDEGDDTPPGILDPGSTCDLDPVDSTLTTFYRQCRRLDTANGIGPDLDINYTVLAVRLADTPQANQDPELLESNIYLPGVPGVDDLATRLSRCEDGGCTLVREIQPSGQPATVEQSGPYGNQTVPKPVDIASLQPGSTRVTVHATKGGSESPRDTTEMKVALILGQWTGGPAKFTTTVENGVLVYKFAVALPKPPFQAQAQVPSFIPFLGGNPFGIKDTQVAINIEGRSSGEVSGTGKADAKFEMAGKAAEAGFAAKAKGKIDSEGISIPDGELGVHIGGKVEAERPLFEAFPQLLPAWNALNSVWPSAAEFLGDRAKAKLSIGPKLDTKVQFKETPTSEGPEFVSAELKPGIETEALITIDVFNDGRVKLEGGVGGNIDAVFQIPAPYFQKAIVTLETKGQVKAPGLGSAEFKRAWTTTLSPSAALAGGAPGAVSNTPSAAASGTPIWSGLDRSYESEPNYARWTGSDVQPAASAAGATDIELAQNVYQDAEPALAASGRRLLLWAHDRPEVTNGEELAFSTSSGAGQPWLAGSQATNDGQSDFAPRVVFLPNGTAMALWQRFDTATPGDPNVDFPAYLNHAQMAASKGTWNGTTWTWTAPYQLSTAPSYNGRYRLGATSTGALAVWVSNPNGQLMGEGTYPDSLRFAKYTTSTSSWSAAAPVVADPAQLSGILDVQLATSGNNAAVVYSRDMDGDLSTSADRELFAALWNGTSWAAPTRLTNNSVADDLPQVALTSTGAPELVWRQDGHLEFLSGSWTAAPVDPGLAEAASSGVVRMASLPSGTLALTWLRVGADDTRIAYAIYDPVTHLWGKARELTPAVTGARFTIDSLSPVLETGRLLIAYQLAAVENVTDTSDGVTVANMPQRGARSLRYAELPLDTNLAVSESDITVSPAGAQPGDPVTISAAIHNTGQLGVAPFDVALNEDGGTGALDTRTAGPIAAGDVVTVTFPFTQPVQRDYTYSVIADPALVLHETTRGDNRALVGFEPKLTALPTLSNGSGLEARARLEMASGLASSQIVTASLRLDDPEGPEVSASSLSLPITGTLSITATGAVSATQIGMGRHLLYWVPSAKPFDASQHYAASAANVLPDLTSRAEWINFGASPGSSAPISVWLTNDGNWASAASELAVFDGDPGQAGSHQLATLPVPAIAPGEFMTVTGTLNLAGLPAASTGLSSIFVKIDPQNVVDELNENNNLVVDTPVGAGGCTALPAPFVSTALSGTDVIVSWTGDPAGTSYELWISQDPYFDPNNPGGVTPILTTNTSYPHVGAASSATNYYYFVRAKNQCGASTGSANRTSKFTFELQKGG